MVGVEWRPEFERTAACGMSTHYLVRNSHRKHPTPVDDSQPSDKVRRSIFRTNPGARTSPVPAGSLIVTLARSGLGRQSSDRVNIWDGNHALVDGVIFKSNAAMISDLRPHRLSE